MISLALLLVANDPFTYRLPDAPITYEVQVLYNGFLPVFGGLEGEFEATLEAIAQAAGKDDQNNPKASSELKSVKIKVNGAELPFAVDQLQNFFPKTTVSHSPAGKVLKTDAPDVKLPVKLPGLDVKRFPDISYLPVEFPSEGIELGKTWTYRKMFGDSEVEYAVTAKEVTETTITLDLAAKQDYTVLEDDATQVVADEKEAVLRVKTTVSGTGTAVFDRKRGIVEKLELKGLALSDVTDLRDQKASKRELKSELKIRRTKG